MTMHHEEVKRAPGVYVVEEKGARRSLQVYPCGCVAVYCLCGCDNAPEIRDCSLHRAALDMLTAAKSWIAARENADDGLETKAFNDMADAVAKATETP